MTTYVGLLHSVVLAPGKRVIMADLKAMVEDLGFRNARTLVATGNLVFDGDDAPLAVIEAQLEAAFRAHFGKHVDFIVRTGEAWLRVAQNNPFMDGNGADVAIRVMRRPLETGILQVLRTIATPDIRLALVDGDLWVDFARKPSETRLLSHLTTRKLGIGTARNANTVNNLARMLD